MRYSEADLAAETELAIPREYQGWAEVIHGGILSTLLDELMARTRCGTLPGPASPWAWRCASMRPSNPGSPSGSRGVMHTPNGSRRQAEGEIIRIADGQRIASGKSRFLLLPGNGAAS